MDTRSPYRGLFMINADVEECDMDSETLTCRNADYVAEVSGELPCDFVKEYDGGLPESPFMRSTNCLDSAENHIRRLTYFTKNIEEWKKKKSTAFQLLDDGRIEYIATALNNKIGEYSYECDHYLKSLHCLQEVVLEETKDIFLNPDQDEYVRKIICKMSQVDDEMLHQFVELLGGVHGLILSYKKCVNVFSEFMGIYANLLPAETYMNFKTKEGANGCIATCSFVDLKSFYQDAYEALLSLMYIPVCLDNIVIRGNFQVFDSTYEDILCPKNKNRDLEWYKKLDNGKRYNKLNYEECYQRLIDFPAKRFLRNGIGHNNINYDGITQIITAYDLKDPNRIKYKDSLMNMAIDCIGLAKSAVVFSEMILFMLRHELKAEGIHSIMHPRFYKGVKLNDNCPCGSGIKYKKCCMNDVEMVLRSL